MNKLSRFSLLTVPMVIMLVLSACGAGCQAYNRGLKAELTRDYETAMAHYRAALDDKPGDIEYELKYELNRFRAAFSHFEQGRRALELGNLEAAKAEFERTLEVDLTHSLARQELERLQQATEQPATAGARIRPTQGDYPNRPRRSTSTSSRADRPDLPPYGSRQPGGLPESG